MTEAQAAVVDTDAFSLLYVIKGSKDPRVADWRTRLQGKRVVISFQTRTEVLTGALTRGWGEKRIAETRQILDGTPTIWPGEDVVDACAALGSACKKAGHPLQNKQHTGDRWVAACAIAKGLPVLAGDGIYQGAPGLTLLS